MHYCRKQINASVPLTSIVVFPSLSQLITNLGFRRIYFDGGVDVDFILWGRYISSGAVVLRFPPAALRGQSSLLNLSCFLKEIWSLMMRVCCWRGLLGAMHKEKNMEVHQTSLLFMKASRQNNGKKTRFDGILICSS